MTRERAPRRPVRLVTHIVRSDRARNAWSPASVSIVMQRPPDDARPPPLSWTGVRLWVMPRALPPGWVVLVGWSWDERRAGGWELVATGVDGSVMIRLDLGDVLEGEVVLGESVTRSGTPPWRISLRAKTPG